MFRDFRWFANNKTPLFTETSDVAPVSGKISKAHLQRTTARNEGNFQPLTNPNGSWRKPRAGSLERSETWRYPGLQTARIISEPNPPSTAGKTTWCPPCFCLSQQETTVWLWGLVDVLGCQPRMLKCPTRNLKLDVTRSVQHPSSSHSGPSDIRCSVKKLQRSHMHTRERSVRLQQPIKEQCSC